MARKATLIYRDWLKSVTINSATDTIECITLRLLLAADDYGRLTCRSTSLKFLLNDFKHTPQEIEEAVEFLIGEGCLEKYKVGGVEYLRWLKWEDYQNIRWRDDAKYPAPDGTYELSDNPQTITKRDGKRTKQRHVKRRVQHVHDHVQVQEHEQKKKSDKSPPSPESVEMVKKLFPKAPEKKVELQAGILDEIVRIDFADPEVIERVGRLTSLDDLFPALNWAAHDDSSFWHGTNFTTCATLRKRKNGATDAHKWEKMLLSYRKKDRRDKPYVPPLV